MTDLGPTRITAHGCEVSAALRVRAESLSQRWPRFDPAVMDISVIFRLQGRSHSVEAKVSRRRREPIVARGKGPDFRVALDDLDAHVKRRLRRDRSRRKEFRHVSSDSRG